MLAPEIISGPEARVPSQRILCAFGLLLHFVAEAAKEPGHQQGSETFVPDVSNALRATFASLRKDAGERAVVDVANLLAEPLQCRQVLRTFLTPPSLRQEQPSLPTALPSAGQWPGQKGSQGCFTRSPRHCDLECFRRSAVCTGGLDNMDTR